MKIFIVWMAIAGALLMGSALWGQNTASVAGLAQDVQRLDRQVKQLQLLTEQLQAENRSLRSSLQELRQHQSEVNAALNQVLIDGPANARLRQQWEAADDALKAALVAEVSRQMNLLAAKVDATLAPPVLAGNRPAASSPPRTVSFDDNFPKTGVEYTVQSGDTLSGLAQRFGSSVRYIQNANRIPDPSKLHVGRVLFIPQDNPQN
ncbi:MAG: LysM peptidoglycan-binding domain-containing protein [Opitutales bacterium]